MGSKKLMRLKGADFQFFKKTMTNVIYHFNNNNVHFYMDHWRKLCKEKEDEKNDVKDVKNKKNQGNVDDNDSKYKINDPAVQRKIKLFFNKLDRIENNINNGVLSDAFKKLRDQIKAKAK